MLNENHRQLCVDVFSKYLSGELITTNFLLYELSEIHELPKPDWKNCVYVLKLGKNKLKNEELSSISNPRDINNILYIGGHESNKITGRYNSLLRSCRNSEDVYKKSGFAENDKLHRHPVASGLTTSVLEAGFCIDDCELELIETGKYFDELELLIGYQEHFHHLPPWNTMRGGISAYKNS